MSILDDAVLADGHIAAPSTGASPDQDASTEPGWGASYGFDRDVPLPGDDAIAAQAESEPEWGASRGQAEGQEVGPFFDALDRTAAGIDEVQAMLAERSVPVADLAAATVQLNGLVCRLQAAHLAALGQTVDAGATPAGAPTANAWIAASHHLDSGRAGKHRKDAKWLHEHPKVAAALAAGTIGVEHVSVMRQVAEANAIRRDAFADFEDAAISSASLTDPRTLRQIMMIWATTVDPDTVDDDADAAYARRRVFLSPVGDGWALNGWLPDVLGAQLAGVLNAYMQQSFHAPTSPTPGHSDDAGDDAPDPDTDVEKVPASARRADALIAMAQAAVNATGPAAGGDGPFDHPASTSIVLSTIAQQRAQVTITVPIANLHVCSSCSESHRDRACSDHRQGTQCPSEATTVSHETVTAIQTALARGSTWAVGNGPGTGHLAPALQRWATCDGEITRLIVDAESRPLNLGRAQRVVSMPLRRVLDVRDRGCIIPGCDRPPGWCHAHHIVHWAEGGRTDVENLALLCQRHHTELHLGHWRITMRNGKPRATHVPAHRRAAQRRAQRAGPTTTTPRRE